MRQIREISILIWGLTALSVAACNLPRDSSGTLDRAARGVIRVGMVVDTPWTTDSAGQAGGIEGQLVRTLATGLGARVEWVHGQQDELLESLKERELDLVVGGLTATSPWKPLVGLTRPYYTDTVLVAGAPGDSPPTKLEGVTVRVRAGDPAAALVRKKGGTPAMVPDLRGASGVIAAPSWRLAQLGRTGSRELKLSENKHVLAAAPGENAWLVRIEQLLASRRSSIPEELRHSAP